MKVALVYDRVNKWGGAERVLLALHEMFPDAPLYTSVYAKKHAGWADIFPNIHTSFLQNLPLVKRKHEFFPFLMPLAFESMNFDDYDLVVSVTSEAAKGIITRGRTKHICYCLTPTRYLWSGYHEYIGRRRILKNVSEPLVKYLRRWDKAASKRPDIMIGISNEVIKRIKKYYERESELLFPPVEVKNATKKIYKDIPLDYFLVVGRFVPYKKVDLVVETFNELNLPLVVVGKGSQEKKLKRMAKNNIQFFKDLSDEDLSNLYKNAKAFVFPQFEDFGMVAVESMAFGVPVIAFNKGGSLDIVKEGKTGVFFSEQSKEGLKIAVDQLKLTKFKKDVLKKHALKFSKDKFKKGFVKILDKHL